MNIYDFSKQKDIDKEYSYKILVYPNITYMRDLEKDSYVVVLRNVIEELNKIRDDIHWTILSPTDIKSLTFENTTPPESTVNDKSLSAPNVIPESLIIPNVPDVVSFSFDLK